MDKKLFIGLFLSFIAATIIGTLSHEFGHYIVAKYFGYNSGLATHNGFGKGGGSVLRSHICC